MKKIFVSLLSLLLAFTVLLDTTFAAADETKIKESYDKVLDYYETNSKTLYYLNDVIALGNAGVDLKGYTLTGEYDLTQDFTKLSAAVLSKHIIACLFMGVDPANVNGTNLITLLEAFVKEDGSVETTYDAYDLVWCVFALKSINSQHTQLVADKLVTYQKTDDTATGSENNNGGFGLSYVSLDTSAWCVEALSNVDKDRYQNAIDNTIEYFNRKQLTNSGYKPDDSVYEGVPYPGVPNTDTQACVIQGLLAYDADGVKAGKYDQTGTSVFDIILNYQLSDGSFISNDTDPSTNSWSTYGATIMLATYYNGSFVLNANKAYENILSGENTQDVPVVENTPKAPATGDTTPFAQLFMVLLSSAAIVLVFGKRYAKAN